MLVVTSVGVLAVLLAALTIKGIFKFGLETAFIVIFVMLAIRYDFGNDYMEYLRGYIHINEVYSLNALRFNSFDVEGEHVEIGWVILCLLCKPIGFFGMTMVTSAVLCFSMYNAIKHNIDKRYYWLAVFIFVFTPNIMMVFSSMMRQAMAVSIFLFSIKYINNRDYKRYFLLTLLAISMHSTAYIMIPLYFIPYQKIKYTKKVVIWLLSILLIVATVLPLLTNNIIDFILFVLPRYNDYYSEMISWNNDIGTGLGFLLNFFLMVFTLLNASYSNKGRRVYFFISYLYFISLVLTIMVNPLYRMTLFLIMCMPIFYTLGFQYAKSVYYKILFFIPIAFFTIYQYIQIYSNPVWKDKFIDYSTIFDAGTWI